MECRVRLAPDLRREQILKEAARLIGERGFYGFTIRELAHRCGLGNAGLLHHFGSKDRLLIAVLEDRDRRDLDAATMFLRARKAAAASTHLSSSEIRRVLCSTAERNTREPEFIRLFAILQAEALNREHPAHQYFLAREAALLDALQSTLAPHVAEPRSIARQLIAQWLGLEQQWLRADQAFDLVEEWDRFLANLLPDPLADLTHPAGQVCGPNGPSPDPTPCHCPGT